jgi:DMSO/TMAO reductase YedYZ molybdopterin-dependent catalytic subunit
MRGTRRTFIRLAAAGLGSAMLPLVGCARRIGQEVGARVLPTPDAPYTPPADWYQMSIQGAYEADRASYRLEVGGVCDRALSLSDAALRGDFPPAVEPVTLACVGNRPQGALLSAGFFRGARFVDLMDAAGVAPEATGAVVTGLDGFVAFRSLEDLRRPEALVAYDLGVAADRLAPLPIEHGFPARLITPGLYGYTQPKWLDSITFVDQGGYLEVLRDSVSYARGAMQLASGFSRPYQQRIQAGAVEVLGYAFGDGRPIGAVHVKVDGGPWEPAEIVFNELADDLPPYLWCLWRFPWNAAPGRRTLTSRASYQDGETQPEGRPFPYAGGALASLSLDVVSA